LLGLACVSAVGCRQILGIEDPVACASDDACNEAARPCVLGECVDGSCAYSLQPEGYVLDELDPGDCKSRVCDASGEAVVVVVDTDAPADTVPGDCRVSVCGADGDLVDADADDPPADQLPGDCKTPTCESGEIALVDDPASCTCELGDASVCYSGPAGTAGVGLCASGTSTCMTTADGNVFGPCVGEVTPAPWDSCLSTDDDDCSGTAEACTGNFVFAKGFGGTGSDTGGSVVEAANGDLFVLGSFAGSVTANNTVTSDGANDALLLRLDKDGNALSGRSFGGVGYDYGSQMVRLDDGILINVVLSGGSSETFGGPAALTSVGTDVAVVKLTDDLSYEWAHLISGTGSEGAKFAARMPDNGVVVAGVFSSPSLNLGGNPLTNAGSQDIFVVRYAADGSHVWSKSFGSAAWDEMSGISLSPTGDIYISCFTQGDLSVGGPAITNAGDYDTVIAKLDSSGNHVWTHAIQSPADDYGPSIVLQSDGSLWAAGGLPAPATLDGVASSDLQPVGGNRDVYLVHFAAAGSYLSGKVFDSSTGAEYFPASLAVGPDDGLVFSGALLGSLSIGNTITSAGADDAFVAKLDASGNPLWAKRAGGAMYDTFGPAFVRSNGDILLAGTFNGNVDFGGGALTNKGASDLVVAKYRQ